MGFRTKRNFLRTLGLGAIASKLGFFSFANAEDVMPPIKYLCLPCPDDPRMPQVGYYGGRIYINGQEYATLYSAPAQDYQRLGREQTELRLRELVKERLTFIWENVRRI
jgi:hypothetical protein